jgi:tetratricopeptide (TPR) repeat protein
VVEAEPVFVVTPAPPEMVEFDLSAEWDMASDDVEAESEAAVELLAPVATEDRAPEAVVVEPAAEEIVLVEDAGELEVEIAAEQAGSEPAAEPVLTAGHEVSAGEELNDTAEECRFYISQEMWDEAEAAVLRLETMDARVGEELRAQLSAARTPQTVVGPEVELATAVQFEPQVEHELAFGREQELGAEPEPVAAQTEATPLDFAPAAPVHEMVASADPMEGLFDLDSALGDDFEIAAPAPVHIERPAMPLTMAAQTQTAVNSAPSATLVSGSAGAATAVALAPEPTVAPVVEMAASAPPSGSFNDSFVDGALADIFAEFKSDMESTTGPAEDPETHYNLGVAFKEMGLLDEAIGELQKVCQAIDQGQPFPQVLQAYTWLADCFVQKGVPEAAIRWYEKALRAPHVQSETTTAIHYELATACELAGNRPAALAHFMEVYGANIDYRDVAERIKALKS